MASSQGVSPRSPGLDASLFRVPSVPTSWWINRGMFISFPSNMATANFQFNKIVLTGLGYSDRKATLMSMPCNTIHLVSVVIA